MLKWLMSLSAMPWFPELSILHLTDYQYTFYNTWSILLVTSCRERLCVPATMMGLCRPDMLGALDGSLLLCAGTFCRPGVCGQLGDQVPVEEGVWGGAASRVKKTLFLATEALI